MTINYTLTLDSPEAHLFKVTLDVVEPAPDGQCFELPNWIPGSYMIRDFSKNIVSISATSQGQKIALEKIDKASWRTPAGLEQVTLEYSVHALDLSVRTAHLDNEHGFFNGTSVFIMAAGHEQAEHTVNLQASNMEPYASWRVATTLSAKEVSANGFGHYTAANYDELIDHPVEMGTFERIEFMACGVPHEVILTGSYYTDSERIANDLKTICEAQIRFFGEPAPVDRYVFLVMVVGDGYGGLEHRASTALLITREHLPAPGDSSVSEKYLSFLGLCSHEYFHTWNVKRIKPAEFVPYKLRGESYTRLLWFFEGVTSYYDDLFLIRTGLISPKQYFDLLSKTITRVQRGAGRLVQSVTDSSFDAWNKFYKQDANAPNAIVSYYAKGALVSLCLDAEIRRASNHKKSLDDLMQQLWQRWLQNGRGLEEREPEHLAAELAGTDLSVFFDNALYSTAELPIESALQVLGVNMHWRARKSVADTGGGTVSGVEESQQEAGATQAPAPWFGANINGGAGAVNVTHVFNNMAAERAGLAPGDTVIAIDNIIVSANDIESMLKRYEACDEVSLHYSRHGVLTETRLPILPAPVDTCSLSPLEGQPVRWPRKSVT